MSVRDLLQERGDALDALAEAAERHEVRDLNDPPDAVEIHRKRANHLTRRVQVMSGVELTRIETLHDLRVAVHELSEPGLGGEIMAGARQREAETREVTR